MKPAYFFLGANSEEGFFSPYDQLLGGRLDDLMILIGGPGCGKSTFLKPLDRMNDLVTGVKITGSVRYMGEDIIDPSVDVSELRRQVGMVFQKATPFPMSIYDNITYGPKLHGVRNKAALDELVAAGNQYDLVITIGPLIMMKFVVKTCQKHGLKSIVSMSPIMIDGTGMCGGCRLTVGGETKFACVDGPDFDGDLVDFDEAMARGTMYRPFEAKAREKACNLFKTEEAK